MIRLLYNLLLPIGLLFFLPAYLVKMRRRGNYRRNFGQRLGRYSAETRRRIGRGGHTWIHAVSVGEVAIALKLAARLRTLEPDLKVVLTTTTTTGFAYASANAPDWMIVAYNPVDLWPVVRRAYRVIRPARLILVEAEIWPNLTAEAKARGVPVALVNARLSPRSERRFQRFRGIVAPVFRQLDLVCVQDESDAARWRGLGVRPETIHHVGSIKFDPEDDLAAGTEQTPPVVPWENHTGSVILGGSTHRGEEELLARIYLRLRPEFPDLKLVIAPRHVERTADVQAELGAMDLSTTCRSALERTKTDADALLINTTGELRRWYSIATVVFIGKSLAARGGQNPVEAILAGKPVVFGPHMENFARLAEDLVRERGALQIRDEEALERALRTLLGSAELRRDLVRNAIRVLDAHRGATERTARLISQLKDRAEAAE